MMRFLLVSVLLLSQSALSYSQKDFINQLLKSHDFFETELINLQIKRIEMLGDQANYSNWDWDISAELGRIHKDKFKYDYTSSTDYAQNTNQTVQKISSDLSKKFMSSGSELTIAFDRSLPIKDEEMHDKNGYQTDKNTTEYLNDLSVSWTLPLLKNKNGLVDQKTYDLAVLDYKDEKQVLAEAQEDFLAEKAVDFIDWVGYQWQLQVVDSTINKLANMHDKLASNHTRDRDILSRSLDKHKRLQQSLRSKLKAQNAVLLGSIDTIDFDKDPPILNQKFNIHLIDDIKQYCQTKVRDLKRIKIEISKNNRSIETYDNSTLPDLDFSISATRDDNKGNYTSYSKSSETEYEAKLVFSYPLSGDITNQVYLDKYRLKSRQLALKYNNKLNDILADVKKNETEIRQGQIQLALINKQLQALNPYYELNLYADNQSDIRFVINEADDYQALKLEKIDVLTGLYQDKLTYDSLLDRLLPI